MPYTQDNRRIAIETPLGKDALLLQRFSVTEAISQPFRCSAELLAEIDKPVDPAAIIGKAVTISLKTAGGVRYFNGIVSRFAEVGADDAFVEYQVEIVPWLWLLTLTSDCRIFQLKAIADILKAIFTDLGFSDFKFAVQRPFPKREYCVQYRETDFNFVSRLMEQYGLRYHFEHQQGKHTLVVTDAHDYEVCALQPRAHYQQSQGAATLPTGVITDWSLEHRVRPGKYALRDYNFEYPSTRLEATKEGIDTSPLSRRLEIYDFPGEYSQYDEGDQLARIRIEEQETDRLVVTGSSTCGGFTPGYRFDLTDHPRRSMNGGYALLTVRHDCAEADYRSGDGEEGFRYVNSFTCVPQAVPFRAPRLTPKPSVQGVQTAKVVGPAGEEIWTDKYSRVKVQFHWDREGKEDENSSCWIRVSQPWAGKGWGSMAIPRIGQEVIVDFLEGDPDQPIIVGRVYNAELMPAQGLPAAQNISGLKSQTVKGAGYNEISMDDTASKEKITIHGQHDLESTIKHDQTWTVKNNKTTTVDGTHTETIDKDTTITIKTGNLTHKVATGTAGYEVKGAVTETFLDTQTTTVTKKVTIESTSAEVHVKGSTEVKLSSGPAFILIKNDGTIQIHGAKVEMIGSQESKIGSSSQSVTCNPQKTEIAGAAISSSAVGVHEISGALIKLN